MYKSFIQNREKGTETSKLTVYSIQTLKPGKTFYSLIHKNAKKYGLPLLSPKPQIDSKGTAWKNSIFRCYS